MSRQTNDLLTRQFNLYANSPKFVNQAGTLSILTSTNGVLHSVSIGSSSAPTCTLYDNASGASGTILALIEPGTRNCYVYDTSYVNGVTAWVTAGNTPAISVSLK